MADKPDSIFQKAKPVWLKGREREMNVQAGFVCLFPAPKQGTCTLRLTGATLYRVFLNGEFLHYGPARAPHGYARVDEVNLSPRLREGGNVLALEVAGYYCSSFYTLRQPSFLQAELVQDGSVARATGNGEDFWCLPLPTRVEKAMRYSFQRAFSEVYELDAAAPAAQWTTGHGAALEHPEPVALDTAYLPRLVPVPDFRVVPARAVVERGAAEKADRPAGSTYLEHRFIQGVSDKIHGYPLAELAARPFETWQDLRFTPRDRAETPAGNGPDLELGPGEYALIDMGANDTGFIVCELSALEDSEVLIGFDEKLIDGRLDLRTWSMVNIVQYTLRKSDAPYRLESFEVYGYRYIQYVVRRGRVRLRRAALREYATPESANARLDTFNEQVNLVFRAARETYRQNAVDVFMDCPTRERGGWLCDSYFTAQSAQFFSGTSSIEQAMVEAFVQAKRFPDIPAGVLPMCYPADHTDGVFIPQWALWYVVQLEGYFRRNAQADPAFFKARLYDLIKFLEAHRNADGLLERLPGWNFIEWSQANDWVQDVHYPTNLLYARVLDLMSGWYGDAELHGRAQQIREVVVKQSFDGKLFRDHATRKDGKLVVEPHTSEVCQYFAFFFDAVPREDPRVAPLVNLVLNVFGPERKQKGLMPELAYPNAFIGNYLRLEVLLRWHRYEQVLREIEGYFAPMAAKTGTLWENDSVTGSLNHGFASFAGVAILRCLLGVQEIDLKAGRVKLDFSPIKTDAEGTIGTPNGPITVKRSVVEGQLAIECTLPPGLRGTVVPGGMGAARLTLKGGG